MGTWHQNQNPTPLWHATKWTVVSKGRGGFESLSRYDTLEQANQDPAIKGGYGYTLPPESVMRGRASATKKESL